MPGRGREGYRAAMKSHPIATAARKILAAVTLTAVAVAACARAEPAPVVARPIETADETRLTAALSPSSALDAQAALVAATTIAAHVRGARVLTVLPTGSMRPMFDEKAYLVVAPAPFASVRVGDIITFKHPRLGAPVVHRVMEKHGRRLWTKGDHNTRPDDVYVTEGNYQDRVIAVIYARECSAAVRRA